MKLTCQKGSSLTTHEALTLGYVTHLNWSPNAELLSTRSAPVMNSRSLSANCSCAYAPIVVLMVGSCVGLNFCAVADTVSTPGPGKRIPPRTLVLRSVR